MRAHGTVVEFDGSLPRNSAAAEFVGERGGRY